MNKKLVLAILGCTVGIVAIGLPQALADERPPRNAKPLSEIVRNLENQGYLPVVEASIDNGVWEIEAYKDGRRRELIIEPVTGQILSDRRDD
jgi:hypothetical protein